MALAQVQTTPYRAEIFTPPLPPPAPRIAPRLELLNVSNLMEELQDQLQASISSNVIVKYDLSADLPHVLGNWLQLRRLVTSLVFNAAEAIGDEPGAIRVQAHAIHASRALLAVADGDEDLPVGEYVWLQIADNGCGMDDQTRCHLFERFFAPQLAGRGLELSAARDIVHQHWGALWVTGSPVRGTNVNVLLPCVG
jgi:signal transduction histidine kinase